MSLLHKTASRRTPIRPGASLTHHHGSILSTRRQFSISAPFVAASTWTAENIAAIHQVGLPWYLTIPLVAVGVNFGLRFPLMYYRRKLNRTLVEIEPIMEAWNWRRVRSRGETSGTASKLQKLISGAHLLRESNKTRVRVKKAFGVQGWKSFSALIVPYIPFAIVSDAFRRLTTAPSSEAASNTFDASMAEGGLLWFTDLTTADPYSALPVTCCSMVAFSIWRHLDFATLGHLLTFTGPSTLRKHIQRAMLLVPIFPLIGLASPAALVFYWLSTFFLTNINFLILERVISQPRPQVLQPPRLESKRPPVFLHPGLKDHLKVNKKARYFRPSAR